MRELFSSDGFMPHGHCYLWKPGLVWLHLISDLLIAVAYTTRGENAQGPRIPSRVPERR